jgi:hypothetical protein
MPNVCHHIAIPMGACPSPPRPIGSTKSSTPASDWSCAGTATLCGYSRNADDWTARLAAIAAAAELIKAKSFTIGGEAVVLAPDSLSRFEELSVGSGSDRDPPRLRLDQFDAHSAALGGACHDPAKRRPTWLRASILKCTQRTII